MLRPVGLHLRYEKSIVELIEKAQRFELPFFQSFLRSSSGNLLRPSSNEVAYFRKSTSNYNYLFAHSWYTINLANHRRNNPVLEHEMRLASQLNFSHIIIHPGSNTDNIKGIDSIAHTLNLITKTTNLCAVLENVPFKSPSIGGNIEDFQAIIEKIDYPERIGFCVDTAHANSYGYDIDPQFIDILDSHIGINKIKLIHLNNNSSPQGSFQDIHCRISDGTISSEKLKAFVQDPRIIDIPILLELPVLDEQAERGELDFVKTFF